MLDVGTNGMEKHAGSENLGGGEGGVKQFFFLNLWVKQF